jgi:mRNA interferase RelE/StbE
MHTTEMSSAQHILLIYTGIYMLILVGVWSWQLKCEEKEPFWPIAVLLILWPMTLFFVICRVRNQFRHEANYSRFRKEREEERQILETAINQGLRSAEESNEILPEERTALSLYLNAFKKGSYETFANSLLRQEIQRFWQAKESAAKFMSLWFGDIVTPSDAVLVTSNVRFARSGSSNPETSHGEWLVALTREFMKSIAQIDRKLQGRILEALGDIAQDPITVKGDTIKPLSHEFAGLWRYRLGDFRLIYQPLPGKRHVLLLALAPRGSAYG